jgi:hypothetical protein
MLAEELKREPTRPEIAARMSVTEDDLRALEEFEQRGYHSGGFKIYDVSKPAQPKLICYQKTGGIGVHRFDMDERYAYISTEMKGYVGNILVIYDLRDPRQPQELSRWWMTGQHIEGGETPTWSGRRHRLHHALRFGNEMWASCWHGGFWVVDVSDLGRPKSAGSYNYHPLFPEPTHTVMPVPDRIRGRRIALAIDEEDQAQSASEEAARRGRAHACLLTFDVSDLRAIQPLAQFQVSELDSPFSRIGGARFGAHQFCERMSGTIAYAVWFGGGLRIIDVADPLSPREVGHSFRSRWRAAPRRRATTSRSTSAASFTWSTATSGSTSWSFRADTSLRRLIEPLGVRAEGFARLRIDVEHMPAAIEAELGARGVADRREMVEDVAAHRVGRHHVAVAVRDQQPKRRNEREQFPHVVGDAGRAASGALAPIPFSGDVG